MSICFDGQVAVVTGAGRGLGRSFALELARRGARVLVNDVGCSGGGVGIASTPADNVVQEIRQAGGNAVADYHTVAESAAAHAIVARALQEFGRLDILISNAGILRSSPFGATPDEDLHTVMEVNLKGSFHVGRPAFQCMKGQGYGRLLFVSSASGVFGHPAQSVYGASKAGLLGLSNVLALEGADFGVQSNVLLPAATTRLADSVDAASLMESRTVTQSLERLQRLGERSERRLEPAWVVPLAVYLVSSQCKANQGAYSSVSGRFARVFIGATPGWAPQTMPSAEEIGTMWKQIESRDGYSEPASVYHEAEQAASRERTAGTEAGGQVMGGSLPKS